MISQEEFNRIMDGMEAVNRIMADEIASDAPTCHFIKMNYEQSDSIDGYYTNWWECSVCGHTKEL